MKGIFLSFAKSALGYTFPKDLNIKSPKDFEGKTFAAVSFASTYQLWPAFAAVNGIDASKVAIINVDPENNVQVVASGKAHFLDGAIGLEDFLLAEADRPADTFLMNDYGLTYPGHGVVANTATIQQKPDIIRRFVNAIASGSDRQIMYAGVLDAVQGVVPDPVR